MFTNLKNFISCWREVRKKSYEQRKAIRMLTDRNKAQSTRDGITRNGCLCYTIRPIQDAVEYYTYQQYSLFDEATAEQQVAERFEEYNHKRPEKSLCAIFSGE